MTTSIPIDTHGDRSRFPRKPVVIYRPGPFFKEDDLEVQVPTETGDLVSIVIERERGSYRDQERYTFQFQGELADIAPEALTAAVQVAFLALREARRIELGLRKVEL